MHASITLIAPFIFVLMNSVGFRSAAGTCFKAAACTTRYAPSCNMKDFHLLRRQYKNEYLDTYLSARAKLYCFNSSLEK